MNVAFTDDGWDDYTHWSVADRKILKQINDLIEDIKRSPYEGIGKPERLWRMEDNVWSRRITHEHRLFVRGRRRHGRHAAGPVSLRRVVNPTICCRSLDVPH